MAQLVEQRIRNAWVAGSSPAIGSLNQQTSQDPPFWLFFLLSDNSSVGRALASQAEGRGFESRIPLLKRKNTRKVKKVTEKFAGFKK